MFIHELKRNYINLLHVVYTNLKELVKIYVLIKIVLSQNRPAGGVTGEKTQFAQEHAPIDKLSDVVKQIKPTAILGKYMHL